MEFFIDTANLDEIKEVNKWGIIDGCTTNPKIVATEGCDFKQRMLEILAELPGKPVSIEVTEINDVDKMVKEAEEYMKWGDNVVIKTPLNIPGLKTTKILTDMGIKTNVTACMSVNQAVLAAKAGGTYTSLFMNRIGDIGHDPVDVIKDTVNIFKQYNFKSKIIIGSIRLLMDINRAALTGADVITVPPQFFHDMTKHPRTDYTLNEFSEFWENYKKEQAEKQPSTIPPQQ